MQSDREMNFRVFRFSISWPRIFPSGIGEINPEGAKFYHNVIDERLKQGVEPWITLYHWDLLQKLEEKGGWTNREIIQWFSAYTSFCADEYGNKVKNWMVMNEPVGLGYMMGYHALGKKGINNFFKAIHYTCLTMAESGRILRSKVKDVNIGSTFSCLIVESYREKPKHDKAATKLDALLNRLFLEHSLGLGYPYDGFPDLKRIEKYFEEGDAEKLAFNFDFIGVQNYFRVIVKCHVWPPIVWAKQVNPEKRGVPVNDMGLEIHPEGI